METEEIAWVLALAALYEEIWKEQGQAAARDKAGDLEEVIRRYESVPFATLQQHPRFGKLPEPRGRGLASFRRLYSLRKEAKEAYFAEKVPETGPIKKADIVNARYFVAVFEDEFNLRTARNQAGAPLLQVTDKGGVAGTFEKVEGRPNEALPNEQPRPAAQYFYLCYYVRHDNSLGISLLWLQPEGSNRMRAEYLITDYAPAGTPPAPEPPAPRKAPNPVLDKLQEAGELPPHISPQLFFEGDAQVRGKNLFVRLNARRNNRLRPQPATDADTSLMQFTFLLGEDGPGDVWQEYLVGAFSSVRRDNKTPLAGLLVGRQADDPAAVLEHLQQYGDYVARSKDVSYTCPNGHLPVVHNFLLNKRMSALLDRTSGRIRKAQDMANFAGLQKLQSLAGSYRGYFMRTSTGSPVFESLGCLIYCNGQASINLRSTGSNTPEYQGFIKMLNDGVLVGFFDYSETEDYYRLQLVFRADTRKADASEDLFLVGTFSAKERDNGIPVAGRILFKRLKAQGEAARVLTAHHSIYYADQETPELSLKQLFQDGGAPGKQELPNSEERRFVREFFTGEDLTYRGFTDGPAFAILLDKLKSRHSPYSAEDPRQPYTSRMTRFFNAYAGRYKMFSFVKNQKDEGYFLKSDLQLGPQGEATFADTYREYTGRAYIDQSTLSFWLFDPEGGPLMMIFDATLTPGDPLSHCYGVAIWKGVRPEARAVVMCKALPDDNNYPPFSAFSFTDPPDTPAAAGAGQDGSAFETEDRRYNGVCSFLMGEQNRYLRVPKTPNRVFAPRRAKYRKTFFFAARFLHTQLLEEKNDNRRLQIMTDCEYNLVQARVHGFASPTFAGYRINDAVQIIRYTNSLEASSELKSKILKDFEEILKEQELLSDWVRELENNREDAACRNILDTINRQWFKGVKADAGRPAR